MQWFSAEVVSTLAATASAVTALFSYNTAKKIANADILPILVGVYTFDNDFITLKNLGKGPAFNIYAQRADEHFLDYGEIHSYELQKEGLTSILPGENVNVTFVKQGEEKVSSYSKKITNYFVVIFGEKKGLGIIYKDIYGNKWISKLHFVPLSTTWAIETTKIKRYRVYHRVWDYIHARYFYFTKNSREKKLGSNQKMANTGVR